MSSYVEKREVLGTIAQIFLFVIILSTRQHTKTSTSIIGMVSVRRIRTSTLPVATIMFLLFLSISTCSSANTESADQRLARLRELRARHDVAPESAEINKLRATMETNGASWVPPTTTNIRMHIGCYRFGSGCSNEYLVWLRDAAAAVRSVPGEVLNSVCDASDKEKPCIDDVHRQPTEVAREDRMLSLLEERVMELETLIMEKKALLAQSVNAADSACIEAHAAVYPLSVDAGTACLRWFVWFQDVLFEHQALLRLLVTSTLLVAGLTWMIAERNMTPEHANHLRALQAQGDVEHEFEMSAVFLKRANTQCILRLRLCLGACMLGLVALSLSSSRHEVQQGWLPYLISYVVPTEWLSFGITLVGTAYAVGSVGTMMNELNNSWNALIDSEGQDVDDRLLL